MVERAGIQAKQGFKAHPHMLPHACCLGLRRGHDTGRWGLLGAQQHSAHRPLYRRYRPIGSRNFGVDWPGDHDGLWGIVVAWRNHCVLQRWFNHLVYRLGWGALITASGKQQHE